MIFGGFCGTAVRAPRPVGSALLVSGSSLWGLGDLGAPRLAQACGRRVLLIGLCAASDRELEAMAERGVPHDAAWRWPGAYAVVEETAGAVAIYTDPAAAYPLYITRYDGGWAWSNSARILAALTDAGVDLQRLAAGMFLPSIPALVGTHSYFTGVRQVPPGHRSILPEDGSPARYDNQWRPDPGPDAEPAARLKRALSAAVALRARLPGLTCDFSGGLDSTSLAVLAADALPAGQVLNAVTIHPKDQFGGADLRYATSAAAAHPERIRHHLLPLGPEHLPYTAITDVPTTDEPVPSTRTRARLTAQLDWMRENLGTRNHLTGDGGDSVLFIPPIHLADLFRHGHRRRAVEEAAGWARLRESSLTPLLRDARSAARITRAQALAALTETIGSAQNDHGAVRWFPLLPHPAWARPQATEHLRAAARDAAAAADPLPGLDAATRTLVDEVREIARSASADAALASARGIELHNPFLDPVVIDAALTVPITARAPLHAYKPLLRTAMADLLPPELAARNTKGAFNADHYTGLRANLPTLLDLTDGHLADLDLIDPAGLRRHLRHAAAGVPISLAAIEQAMTAEAWLRAHHREPLPAWTHSPERSDRV